MRISLFRLVPKRNPHSGFTLLEVVVVVAVLAILVVAALPSLFGFLLRAQFDNVVDTISEYATQARGNAVANQDFVKWGIHVENPSAGTAYVSEFSCTTTACGTNERTEQRRYSIAPSVSLLVPTAGTSEDLIFTQRSGALIDGTPHYVVVTGSSNLKRAVVLNPVGQIDVLPLGNTATALSTTGSGNFSHAALAQDGFPIFAHVDDTTNVLVTKCTTWDCTQNATQNPGLFSGGGGYGHGPVISVLASGNPFLAVQSFSPNTLKTISCANSSCAPPEITQTPDSSPKMGGIAPSMVLDPQGLPVMVHYEDQGNGKYDLRFVRCSNIQCTAAVTRKLSQAPVIYQPASTSIAIMSNGYPIIAFVSGSSDHNVIACNDPNCDPDVGGSGPDPVYPLSSTLNGRISMAIGRDGNPVIAGNASVPNDLALGFLHCTAFDCSSTSPVVLLDPSGVFTGFNDGFAIAVGSDGLPAISYIRIAGSKGGYAAWFAKCTTSTCENGGTPAVMLTTAAQNPVSNGISLVLDRENRPAIGFHQSSPTSLFWMVTCANPFCF